MNAKEDPIEKNLTLKNALLLNYIRFAVVAVTGLLGIPIGYFALSLHKNIYLALLLALFMLIYNSASTIYIQRKASDISLSIINNIISIQFFFDIVAVSLLVHITGGGVVSAYTFFYLFPILTSSMIMLRSPAMIYLLTAQISILYVALLIIEYFGWLQAPQVFPLANKIYEEYPFLGISYAFLVPLTFWMLSLIAARASVMIRKRREELEFELRQEIQGLETQLAKKLEETNAELYKKNRELQENEKRYQIIADETGQLIYDYNVQSGNISWLGPISEVTGYTSEEFQGVNIDRWKELIHPDDRKEVLEKLNTAEIKGTEFHATYRFRQKNGTYIFIEDDGVYIPGETDAARRMLGAMKNISERKKTEQEMKLSEDRFKVLYESSPDAIYISDLKGVFIDGNRAAEKLLGYSRKELIGKNLLAVNLIMPNQIAKAAGLLVKNNLGQSTGPDELTLMRRDGSRVQVEISTHPVQFMEQTMVLGSVHDISDRRRSDLEFKKHAEELEKMNKFLVGREMSMIELKKEINGLLKEMGKNEKYRV